MRSVFRFLPNAMTLGNLAAGATGLYLLSGGHVINASWMILLAALLDLLDGMVARAVGVDSPIGRDLDSLADLVSFGVLPGALAGWLIKEAGGAEWMVILSVIIVPVSAAYRLARFNNDPGQGTSFKGLPAPANGIFLGTWALGIAYGKGWGMELLLQIAENPTATLVVVAGSSFLMLSRIPLLSFKFSSLKQKSNIYRGALILAAIVLFIMTGMAALPFIVLLYILTTIFTWGDET